MSDPQALNALADRVERAAGPWLKVGDFEPERDAYYLVQGSLRLSVKRGQDIDGDNLLAALIRTSPHAQSGEQ